MPPVDETFWIEELGKCHRHIRDRVLQALHHGDAADLTAIVHHAHDDVIFGIDRIAEAAMLEYLEQRLAKKAAFVVIAEGIEEPGGRVFPQDRDPEEVPYRLIIDPIDGTRPLMYDKRSGWILTGVAENKGPTTGLHDVFFAMQTEIPVQKQCFADMLWAFKQGDRAYALREHLATGNKKEYAPASSSVTTLDQGFACFVNFFHGSKELISRIDEAVAHRLFGPVQPGRTWSFEDQYMSTGGQLYELATGRDRFIADLRALIERSRKLKGEAMGLCCHTYDLCTFLIAEKAGCIITDETGAPLSAPLDTQTAVSWIGYANHELHKSIQPILQEVLQSMGLLPSL